jgi:opacity protein-like surface antigen
MKKLVVVLFVFAVCFSNAQQLSIGPRVGMNFSNMKDLDNSESLTGLSAGASFGFRFLDFLGVSVDALYSAEGSQYVVDFDQTKYKFKSRLSYLRVPVLLNAYLGPVDAPIRAKIMAGPALGFLLDAKNEVDIAGLNTEFDLNKSDFNSTDFGAIAGAGVDFVLSDALTLDLDGRYYFGASKIFKNDITSLEEVKNGCATISAALLFTIGD